jgi:hypothetical protein
MTQDIRITSKLSDAARKRLTRQGEHDMLTAGAVPGDRDFRHAGRNTYSPLDDYADPHAVARRMMVIAGTTFEYEVI